MNVGQVHDGRRAGDGRAVHVLQVQAGGQAVLCYKVAPHLDKVSLHRIITYYVSTKQKAKITLINANLHISRFLQGSYPNSDVERLQTQCFKSVWVATALHQVRKGKRKILIKKPLWSRSYFPTTGFDIPAQLWSPDGSTQHSPRGGRCPNATINTILHLNFHPGGSLDSWSPPL